MLSLGLDSGYTKRGKFLSDVSSACARVGRLFWPGTDFVEDKALDAIGESVSYMFQRFESVRAWIHDTSWRWC